MSGGRPARLFPHGSIAGRARPSHRAIASQGVCEARLPWPHRTQRQARSARVPAILCKAIRSVMDIGTATMARARSWGCRRRPARPGRGGRPASPPRSHASRSSPSHHLRSFGACAANRASALCRHARMWMRCRNARPEPAGARGSAPEMERRGGGSKIADLRRRRLGLGAGDRADGGRFGPARNAHHHRHPSLGASGLAGRRVAVIRAGITTIGGRGKS